MTCVQLTPDDNDSMDVRFIPVLSRRQDRMNRRMGLLWGDTIDEPPFTEKLIFTEALTSIHAHLSDMLGGAVVIIEEANSQLYYEITSDGSICESPFAKIQQGAHPRQVRVEALLGSIHSIYIMVADMLQLFFPAILPGFELFLCHYHCLSASKAVESKVETT